MFKHSIATLTLATLALSAAGAAEKELDPAEIDTFRPYQLNHCLVSDEKIGTMGEGISMVHKGQEITFCCKMCVGQFAKKPEHFMKKLQHTEAAKAGEPKADKKHKAGEHKADKKDKAEGHGHHGSH